MPMPLAKAACLVSPAPRVATARPRVSQRTVWWQSLAGGSLHKGPDSRFTDVRCLGVALEAMRAFAPQIWGLRTALCAASAFPTSCVEEKAAASAHA